jgi:glycosyltransferase involved in cell wall biosynthesis
MLGYEMLTDLKEESNGKIKVLFFISSLVGGGAERVMVDILHHIDKNKIEPSLVLLYPYDDSPYKQYLPKDIKITIVKRKSDSFVDKMKQFAAFIQTVFREKPHIILSMLTHNNIMAILSAMLFKIKVVVCEHITLGEMIKTKEGKKILWFPVAPLVKIIYRYSDKVIAVSEGIKADLIEEFHIPAHKIQTIHNPIDLRRINELSSMPPENPFFKDRIPIVIAIGRLVRQKGFDTLIKAFSLVIPKMNAQLIIIGEGPERESMEEMVKDLGLIDKVFFAGFQSNPYKFLSRADVFVLSSNYEGLPMVILEAMACGIIVISTDCRSGPREILQDGKFGFLVPVGDEQALSKGIVRLLKDRPLREKLSRLVRERAKDFSIDTIIKQYEREFYEIIAD